MKQERLAGRLLALFCVLVWGSSFVVSKSLITHFRPLQLMLVRFILAYLMLWVIHPKWYFHWREEGRFLCMALFANTLYCWAENSALTITNASNVSILVSTSPIITAVVLSVLPGGESLNRRQAVGFGVAFLGVVLVVLNGAAALQVRPLGDLLALLAACAWTAYGILLRRWGGEYDSVLITRKLMFYGALTVLPLVVLEGTPVDFPALLTVENGVKLAYLGLVGSALCYLCWGKAVRRIGVLQTNLYIYMVPLVTLLVSVVALGERITLMGALGMALVLSGMVLSELTHNLTQNRKFPCGNSGMGGMRTR